MGKPPIVKAIGALQFYIGEAGKPGKWNISVPGEKEIVWDSVSSGERKRMNLNLLTQVDRGCRVKNNVLKRQEKALEWAAKEGESPVSKI